MTQEWSIDSNIEQESEYQVSVKKSEGVADRHDYAFFVAASENYIPGIQALFNSMAYHEMQQDVILLSFDLPADYIDSLADYSFNIRVFETQNKDSQVVGTAIERFRLSVEYGPEYKAICLLDADMFFHRDVSLFFDIAAAGFIVTTSNGMIINFNKEYQTRYQVDLGSDEYPYPKVHTTAPIFVGPADLDWFERLYTSRRIDSWDDFLYLNVLGIDMGKADRMICLPAYAWTGIHHWQLKIETSIRNIGPDLILTGTEEPIYMSHGKFWDEGYNQDLIRTMDDYRDRWDMGARCESRVADACDTLLGEFQKYLNYKF